MHPSTGLMKSYNECLQDYEAMVRLCINVSHAAEGKEAPVRKQYACMLLTRLCNIAVSMLCLLPRNTLVVWPFENWDCIGVANLARCLIEAYNTFYYIAVDPVTPEEEECRFLLCQLHGGIEKHKLLVTLGILASDLQELNEGISDTREELLGNVFFQSFPPKEQQDLLKGRRAMYLKRQEIVARLGFDGEIADFYYRLLSNHIHTTPFSFFEISEGRGRGLANPADLGYMSMFTRFCSYHLAKAVNNMIDLFPEIEEALDAAYLELSHSLMLEAEHKQEGTWGASGGGK